MKQYLFLSLSLVSLFCVPRVVCAQGVNLPPHNAKEAVTDETRFGNITPEILSSDSRLSQQLTSMVTPAIYLSDLMNRWKEQTGITFEARDDGKDMSGRWRVMVGLRDAVSVSDAMDALRSGLSEQEATWQWQRSGTAPNYEYRLVSPPGWARLQETLRGQAQDRFEEALNIAKRGLAMSPEELKQAASSDSTGTLRSMVNNPQIRAGLDAFISNVSSEQQQALMRGERGDVTLPISAMNNAGKGFASDYGDRMYDANKALGMSRENATPTKVVIQRLQYQGEGGPSLMIAVGNDNFMSGGCYLGTPQMVRAQSDALARRMVLRDDEESSKTFISSRNEKIVQDQIRSPKHSSESTEWLSRHGLQSQLLQLAEAASPRVNFIARLPQSFGSRECYELRACSCDISKPLLAALTSMRMANTAKCRPITVCVNLS